MCLINPEINKMINRLPSNELHGRDIAGPTQTVTSRADFPLTLADSARTTANHPTSPPSNSRTLVA
jgi:hypothetical protein